MEVENQGLFSDESPPPSSLSGPAVAAVAAALSPCLSVASKAGLLSAWPAQGLSGLAPPGHPGVHQASLEGYVRPGPLWGGPQRVPPTWPVFNTAWPPAQHSSAPCPAQPSPLLSTAHTPLHPQGLVFPPRRFHLLSPT